jgi:hypothetical protein
LDDVDLGTSGREEHDSVECGDVDAFGEALGVGEYSALAVGWRLLEPADVGATVGTASRMVSSPCGPASSWSK